MQSAEIARLADLLSVSRSVCGAQTEELRELQAVLSEVRAHCAERDAQLDMLRRAVLSERRRCTQSAAEGVSRALAFLGPAGADSNLLDISNSLGSPTFSTIFVSRMSFINASTLAGSHAVHALPCDCSESMCTLRSPHV